MATHSSILAWEIPQTEEAAGLYSPRDLKQSNMTEHVHRNTVGFFFFSVRVKTMDSENTFLLISCGCCNQLPETVAHNNAKASSYSSGSQNLKVVSVDHKQCVIRAEFLLRF